MATKRLIFADEARKKLLSGMTTLVRAVSPTLGPIGGNVAVDGRSMAATKRYGPPQIVAQGQHIIRGLELQDQFENLGVKLLQQAAQKTDDMVGDGSTTTIILAYAMLRQGIKNIIAGAHPTLLRRGIEKAAQSASRAILEMAKPVRTVQDLRQVLSSAASNPEIAEVLLWAIDEVGIHGMIRVERFPKTLGIAVECIHGFQYERGYLSPYFVTNPAEEAVELERPYILLTDEEISRPEELIPLLKQLAQQSEHDLLVIAPEIKEAALALLIANHQHGIIRCAAVRPPSYGDFRKEMLEDLAIFTGATIHLQGNLLSTLTLDVLGRADSAYVTAQDTTITDGLGDAQQIQQRIAEIRARLSETINPPDREKLERRIAQLAGGLARIRVGGATEAEMDNRIEHVESALTSMQAAIEEGVVPGAGVAMAMAAATLDDLAAEGDEATGIRVVQQALQMPLRQIVRNAGQNDAVVLATLQRLQRETGGIPISYDALTNTYVDAWESGIVDPCKTVRTILANAVSCTIMALTTDVLILDRRPIQRNTQHIR